MASAARNVVESLRDVVQDLLVPEFKALKVSVDGLREDMHELRSDVKESADSLWQEMRLRDQMSAQALAKSLGKAGFRHRYTRAARVTRSAHATPVAPHILLLKDALSLGRLLPQQDILAAGNGSGRVSWGMLTTAPASMALLFLSFGSVTAQQPVPTVEKLLPQLYANAREYLAKLPSLSCDESITSQALKKGKVQREVKIESVLREVREATGSNNFSEKHQFTSVDGHPPPPKFNIPFFVQGGFANAIGFQSEDKIGCYNFHLASQDSGKTLKLDIAFKPNDPDPACHQTLNDSRKTVLVDAASGRIIYVERTVSPEDVKLHHEVFFASMEYGPQRMGDETVWLPIRMTAHDPKDEGQMIVTYSNYHRYVASSTILPADPPVGEK
jgi:hypothetical protein